MSVRFDPGVGALSSLMARELETKGYEQMDMWVRPNAIFLTISSDTLKVDS